MPEAERDLAEIDGYISLDSTAVADRFLDLIRAHVLARAVLPRRHPIARERQRGLELRQIVVKSYRVLFTFRGTTVFVLRIGHGARRNLPPRGT